MNRTGNMQKITNKIKELERSSTKLYWTEVFLFGGCLCPDKDLKKILDANIDKEAENILKAIDNCRKQIDNLYKIYRPHVAFAVPSFFQEPANVEQKKSKESPGSDTEKDSLNSKGSEKPS